VTETQKRKAVRTNVRVSFVQTIENCSGTILCQRPCKAMKKRRERSKVQSNVELAPPFVSDGLCGADGRSGYSGASPTQLIHSGQCMAPRYSLK
jgi:hypothetical protein